MSSPRVPMLSIDEAKKAASEARVSDAIAELSIFRILLRKPKLAKRVNDLLMTLLLGGDLDARLRELIIMRIGWATGSVYEWTQHWRVALQLGVEESDLLAVRNWQDHSHWSDVDRAILRATDETLENGAISAETWAECAKHLPSDTEQLELVGAIGTWRMISGILKSLDVPLEDGVAEWPPDGLSPDQGGA
ncbi:MAG: carboxymuconolactone decarboxylase family protein [bacterium]|nr:carboxymuconolactone decarboxylase family protein [bacterium]